MTLAEYFADEPKSERLFHAVQKAIDAAGSTRTRVTKSQVSFLRRTAFAWVWMPRMYLGHRAAPLVVTLALRRRDRSPRWKEVVEPRPGRFVHHLELQRSRDVDAEVRAWIQEAWDQAG
jgi:hypothetical protein